MSRVRLYVAPHQTSYVLRTLRPCRAVPCRAAAHAACSAAGETRTLRHRRYGRHGRFARWPVASHPGRGFRLDPLRIRRYGPWQMAPRPSQCAPCNGTGVERRRARLGCTSWRRLCIRSFKDAWAQTTLNSSWIHGPEPSSSRWCLGPTVTVRATAGMYDILRRRRPVRWPGPVRASFRSWWPRPIGMGVSRRRRN